MSHIPEPVVTRHAHTDTRGEPVSNRTALIIHTIADVAAGFLGLWILLHLLEANGANPFVQFIEGMANWLAGWSQDVFTMKDEHVRFALNYGLPALVYLFIGHGVAAKIRRG